MSTLKEDSPVNQTYVRKRKTVTEKAVSKTLLERAWRGNQALQAEVIVLRLSDEKRFRSLVYRDGYDHQSYILSEVWTEVGWKTVTRAPISGSHTERYSYVTRDDHWKMDAIRDGHDAIGLAMNVVP